MNWSNRSVCSCLLITGLLLSAPGSGRGQVGTEKGTYFMTHGAGMTQVLAVNNVGDFIGSAEESDGTTISVVSFIQRYDQKDVTKIPSVPGYSNVEPLDLSDNGCVVGMASRATRGEGRTSGFVWNLNEEKPGLLRPPATYSASVANAVSRLGTRIAGYCVGANPPRIMPCIWDRVEGEWAVEVLPVEAQENTLLPIGRIVISDDGNCIAACTTVPNSEGELGLRSHQLTVWRRSNSGWQSEKIFNRGGRLGGINDRAEVAGSFKDQGKFRAFVVDAERQFHTIDLLPGDVSNEALDINNQGKVVGYSDDPRGPEGGPTAFQWRAGEMNKIDLGANVVFSYAQTINAAGQIGGYAIIAEKGEGDAGQETASTKAFVTAASE